MRLNWIFTHLGLLSVLLLVCAGCSGINTSQNVSPASFFLPGLMKNDAPTNVPALAPEISTQIASAK